MHLQLGHGFSLELHLLIQQINLQQDKNELQQLFFEVDVEAVLLENIIFQVVHKVVLVNEVFWPTGFQNSKYWILLKFDKEILECYFLKSKWN